MQDCQVALLHTGTSTNSDIFKCESTPQIYLLCIIYILHRLGGKLRQDMSIQAKCKALHLEGYEPTDKILKCAFNLSDREILGFALKLTVINFHLESSKNLSIITSGLSLKVAK